LHLFVLAGVLAAIALAGFLHKVLVLGFPLKPEERTDVWRVEVQIRFEAEPSANGIPSPRWRHRITRSGMPSERRLNPSLPLRSSSLRTR
jgi:hypothetical protein